MDYTAQYQPAGEGDRSKSGFATEEAAWNFVFEQMCHGCLVERQAALAGEGSPEYAAYMELHGFSPSTYPGCSCEWMVLPTDKADAPFEERMEAAGWKHVEFFDILDEASK